MVVARVRFLLGGSVADSGASGSRHNEPIRLYFYFRHAAYRAIPSRRLGYRDAPPTHNATTRRATRTTRTNALREKREREREVYGTRTRCSRASAPLATAPRHAGPRHAEPSYAPRHATPSRPSRSPPPPPPLLIPLDSMLTPTPLQPPPIQPSSPLRCAFIEHTYVYTRIRVYTQRLSALPPFSRDAQNRTLPSRTIGRGGERWSGREGTRVPNVVTPRG